MTTTRQASAAKGKGNDSLVELVKDIPVTPRSRYGPVSMVSTVNEQPSTQQLFGLISDLKTSLELHKEAIDQQMTNLTSKVTELGASIRNTIKEEVRAATADINSKIDEEVATLTNKIDHEVAGLNRKIDDKVTGLTNRIDDIEQKINDVQDEINVEYDPEVSIIISKVAETPGENVQAIVEEMVHRDLGLPGIQVVRATRMPQREQRDRDRRQAQGRDDRPQLPPLIKAQFRNIQEKVEVLKEKRRLAASDKFSRAWMRSSKPHAERVADMNNRLLLGLLQGGDQYTVTSHGKIVKKTAQANA